MRAVLGFVMLMLPTFLPSAIADSSDIIEMRTCPAHVPVCLGMDCQQAPASGRGGSSDRLQESYPRELGKAQANVCVARPEWLVRQPFRF